MVVDPDMARSLVQLLELASSQNTTFDDVGIAGKDILAAQNSNLPPNQRIAGIYDNDHLTIDEVLDELTFTPPYYIDTVPSNTEHIIRTRERNTYFNGAESVASVTGKMETPIPDGQFAPTNTIFEFGYGGLETGTLSGVPHTGQDDPGNYDRDGIFMRLTSGDAAIRIYKDGDVAKHVSKDDWNFDPFEDSSVDWNANRYFQLVIRFDPAAAASLWLKMRDRDGESVYKKIHEIGFQSEPLLNIFDMPVSIRVETTGTVSQDIDWRLSGLGYFNRTSGDPPFRSKTDIIRNPSVANASLGSPGDATVIALYRLDPSKVEAVTRVTNLTAQSPDGDFKAQTREIHRDHLTFPSGFNPDADGSWIYPEDQRAADSALQKADVDPGEITIQTHTDTDGQTKLRGKQDAVVYVEAGGGKANAAAQEAVDVTTLSELNYLAVIGQIAGNNDPAFVASRSEQRW